MPQTIWEGRQPTHPAPEYSTPMTGLWSYIGGRTPDYVATPATGGFWTNNLANTKWTKAIVRNQLDNSWTILNDVYKAVDYTVEPKHNQITIKILPSGRDDITQYWVEVDTVPAFSYKTATGVTPATIVITTGVVANTAYTANVRGEIRQAGETDTPETGAAADWTPDSLQAFNTPLYPVPTAPLNLRSPNRSNDWIDLAWDASANGQALSYQVFSRVGLTGNITRRAPLPGAAALTAKTVRISGLAEDTKYQWWVVGVGPTGLISPPSNVLKWATGHDAVTRTGSVTEEPLHPDEWGSWRKDIGWNDWHDWPGDKHRHHWVYQGYWPGPRNTGPTSPNTSEREQNGRYKGIVTYDAAGFRARLNKRFGYDVGGGFGRGEVAVTKVVVQRPYRQRQPGNLEAQWIKWWIAWATPFSGEPTLRESHINDRDDADHMKSQKSFKAGTDRHSLRLPRAFGRALVQGWYENTGSKVNALGMYRGDNEHNGYGTAGYSRFAGHLMHDDVRGYTDESSNWTIFIDCHWTIKTVAYLAPYIWS